MPRNEYQDDQGPPQGHQPPAVREQPMGTMAMIASTYLHGAGLEELAGLVPPGIDQVRVVNAFLAAVKQNKDLQTCTYESLTAALVDCARLGLWPGPAGHMYLIPYSGKATAIIGYQGLSALMRRQGVSHVDTAVVYSEEEKEGRFRVTKGTSPGIRHNPIVSDADRGEPIAFYAVAHFEDGSPPAFEVMTLGEVEEIRQATNVWDNHPREMARKTVLRRLAKWVGTDDALGHAFDVMDRDQQPEPVTVTDVSDTKQAIRARMGK